MRILLTLFYFSFLTIVSYGQEEYKNIGKKIEAAEEAYYEGNFVKAYKLYSDLAQVDSEDSSYFKFRKATCLVNMDQDEQAALSILRSESQFSQSEFKSAYYYFLGESFHLNENFDSALFYLEKSKEGGDFDALQLKDVNQKITQVNYAKEQYANAKNYNVFDVKGTVNSTYKDYKPLISSDESVLIFTSKRSTSTGQNKDENDEYFEDIYTTSRDNLGYLSEVQPISKNINTNDHEASVGISPDGRELILYKGDEHSGAFFVSKQSGTEWSTPQMIDDGKTINHKKFWETSACMTLDHKTIFFTSDRKGGLGGLDIYMAKKKDDGQWGEPKNLGNIINSDLNEESPFIHPDGKTLFFSSRGGENMGGYDIFRTVLQENGSWSIPENLGYPINTVHNDVHFSLTADGRKAYFSSSRIDSQGKEDIYKVVLDENVDPLILIKGLVKSADGGSIESVAIEIIDKKTDESLSSVYKPNSSSGKYLIIVPPGDNYSMVVTGDGFEKYQIDLNIPSQDKFHELYQEVVLKKISNDSITYEEITVYNSFDNLRESDHQFDPELLHPNATYVDELIHDVNANKENKDYVQKKIDHIDVLTDGITQSMDQVVEKEEHTEELFYSTLNTTKQITRNGDTINVLPNEIYARKVGDEESVIAQQNKDTDGDGFSNGKELTELKSNPLDPCDPNPNCEACKNRVLDDNEIALTKKSSDDESIETDLLNVDSDNDGLIDYAEIISNKVKSDPNDPCDPDPNCQACKDYLSSLAANNNNADDDKDGISNYNETIGNAIKSDPNDPCDPNPSCQACLDQGGSKKSSEESIDNTLVNSTDTDGDGLTDYNETTGNATKSDPNDPCDPNPNCQACLDYKASLAANDKTDSDKDGLTDYNETTGNATKSDPNDPCDPNPNCQACLDYKASLAANDKTDSDKDGLTDYNETTGNATKSDPNDPCDPNPNCQACLDYKASLAANDKTDSDKDGLTDYNETTGNATKSDPNDPCDPNPNCQACLDSKKTTEATAEFKPINELIIYFDFTKHDIKSTYFKSLKQIADNCTLDKSLKLKIEGHADAIGHNSFNLNLSKKRVKSVTDFIAAFDILEDRYTTEFFGEEKPAASNTRPDGSDNPNGRQLNRRAVIKVYK